MEASPSKPINQASAFKGAVQGLLQELRWREGAPSKASQAHGAFEVVDPIDPDTNGRTSRTVRRELQRGRSFLDAIDVALELLAVVDRSHVIPSAERMKALRVEQSLLGAAGLGESIKTPAAINDPDFKQQPIVRAILLEMKPTLLPRPAVGAKDRSPRELRGSSEGMDVKKESVVHAV